MIVASLERSVFVTVQPVESGQISNNRDLAPFPGSILLLFLILILFYSLVVDLLFSNNSVADFVHC